MAISTTNYATFGDYNYKYTIIQPGITTSGTAMEPLADNGLIWEFIPPFLNTFFSMIIMVFFTMYERNKAGKM